MTTTKAISERVAELLAEAPPLTDEQRHAALAILVNAKPARGETSRKDEDSYSIEERFDDTTQEAA